MDTNLTEQTNPEPAEEKPEALLRVTDVADICNVEVGTVYTWVARRTIPHVKLGSLVRFRRDDINRYLNEHVVAPVR